MADQERLKIIEENPMGKGLDKFRLFFEMACTEKGVAIDADSLGDLSIEDLHQLSSIVLVSLQSQRAANLIQSKTGWLRTDIRRLATALASDAFDFDRIIPLLKTALTDPPQDVQIWKAVEAVALETTPPPRPLASSLEQTPWQFTTGSIMNSSELQQRVDRTLKEEIGPLYVGVPNFCEAFFGSVPNLTEAAKAVFRSCCDDGQPLFGSQGWNGWPADAKEGDVLAWMGGLIPKLEALGHNQNSTFTSRRKLLAQPKTPLLGSTGKRSLDVGFVNKDFTYGLQPTSKLRYRWSHILIPGELKNTPASDIPSIAWIDLAKYVREMLGAQDNRRFVLGFTLCGSIMRIWEFDRLGAIASEKFDINKDGLQFVTAMLGFLYMSEADLGFDPTIVATDDKRYIEIKRNGQRDRLIIDEVMRRTPCVSGRATTCWKAHSEKDPFTPLVIKDSWQYQERTEEGELFHQATDHGVVNVARYYHHETVRIGDMDDDITANIRKGLDLSKATKYPFDRLDPTSRVGGLIKASQDPGSSTGSKRRASRSEAGLPPSKRSRSRSAHPTADASESSNRIHRRVILRDYGKPIYKASSRVALLSAIEGCIEGHESLHKAGLLHRDISVNNLMINEDRNNPSWKSFLIDLDLAIKENRQGSSGAKSKTGTRVFMAIGALYGDVHTFMHDLESFFWVLFWICIHYDGHQAQVVDAFDEWNYGSTTQLADVKAGLIASETRFLNRINVNFTEYYKPLAPWVNRLRRQIFPGGRAWEDKEDPELYVRVKRILQQAQLDPKVL